MRFDLPPPQEAARLLGGEVYGKNGVLAPGPGHSSQDRSLSIKFTHKNPDGFVVHSFAGDDDMDCKDYVRDKLGLTINGQASSRSTIVECYDYVDEAGTLLFQVVRWEPKRFSQRRPNGRDWTWNLGYARRVLYRLPELLEAVALEKPVFICEGEKAVNAIARLGLPATCSPGGAGKWRPEYNTHLKGANVVILPDNDESGEDHAEQVRKALADTAARVKVLRLPGLPQGGDPFDWVKAGGNADQLWALVEALDGRAEASASGTDDSHSSLSSQWPTLSDEALHGLAGKVVETIAPQSEADPVAILIQFLVSAGNILGRFYYYQIEGDRHHANLFTALVGDSSKSRKGTSWSRVKAVAKIADEQWFTDRTKGGLSSGEGFIYEVRDPIKKWNAANQAWDLVDPGVTDKRLTVIEPEFSAALAVMERHGNTLSQHIRKAWDGDKLSALTRTSPLTATEAHISVIGHITETELKARLTRTDAANGFANRFLFVLVKRSQFLPFGGSLTDETIKGLGNELKQIVEKVPNVGSCAVTMTDAAKEHWKTSYRELSAANPGLLGAITARSEAQTIRLALIYALLDAKAQIDLVHLKAGMAVWAYCKASASRIFGGIIGNPVADELLASLRSAGPSGLSLTDLHAKFSRHRSAAEIRAGLDHLVGEGFAIPSNRGPSGKGRPAEVWVINPSS